jgi:hypothetical protein
VSILIGSPESALARRDRSCANDSRLCFEVLHDVQEAVVNLGLVLELDLDLV